MANVVEDKIGHLYRISEEMSKVDEATKEKHYLAVVDYLKNSDDSKVRILSAQLIARFFKLFPKHEEQALDSIVDLCESIDVSVRKHAAISMIAICRDCKHLVSKAADILIQLYQTNEPSEVNLINQSLTTLLNLDVLKFLQSFFTNFEDGSEVVRERALKLLSNKIHLVPEEKMTKQVEEQLLKYSKKAAEDVTKDEFITFISILSKLKIAKTAVGQAMILLVIKSQADLDKDFDPNDRASLDKFLLCTKHTIPYLSQYNRASEYINYICLKMLPHLGALSTNGGDLRVLQTLAEMSPFVHQDDVPKLIELEQCQRAIYDKLMEYMPQPDTVTSSQVATEANDKPAKDDQQVDNNKGSGETGEQKADNGKESADATETSAKRSQEADFQFTHIEYLMYTFHQFGRLNADFFNESLQNEIKLRLQHLALGCTKYTEVLSNQLRNVKGGDNLKEENKLRSVALRTTKNITLLVRDLFKRPPQFKTSIPLSCKVVSAANSGSPASTGAAKRLMSSSADNVTPPKRIHH